MLQSTDLRIRIMNRTPRMYICIQIVDTWAEIASVFAIRCWYLYSCLHQCVHASTYMRSFDCAHSRRETIPPSSVHLFPNIPCSPFFSLSISLSFLPSLLLPDPLPGIQMLYGLRLIHYFPFLSLFISLYRRLIVVLSTVRKSLQLFRLWPNFRFLPSHTLFLQIRFFSLPRSFLVRLPSFYPCVLLLPAPDLPLI